MDSLLPAGPRVLAAAAPVVMPSAAAAISEHTPERLRPEGDVVAQIPLELIDENPYQTRRNFDPAALNELADSIRASGLAQPVVVRPGTNGRYVLVLGERRCRACKLAGATMASPNCRGLGALQHGVKAIF